VGYFEASGEGLPYYVDMLEHYRRRLGWKYGRHFVPQDARVKEWGSGKTRIEELFAAGIWPSLVPPHSIEDGINACRHTLPHCWFAEDECSTGIRHLKHYRKDWDSDRGVWKDKPRHDSSSHAADAFRYLSMAWREVSPDPVVEPKPKEIIKAMCKPKTWAQMWAEYAEEQGEGAEDLPEGYEDFNLNLENK
jgi:phage terminase large subunit